MENTQELLPNHLPCTDTVVLIEEKKTNDIVLVGNGMK